MKTITLIVSMLVFILYAAFRLELKNIEMGNLYFIGTCLFFSYFIFKDSTQFKGLLYLTMLYVASFFFVIACLFCWYWIVLHDPAIWVYRSMLIALPISFFINIFTINKAWKYFKH